MLGMPGGRGGMQLQSKVVEVATGGEARLDLAIEKGPVTVTIIAALSGAAGVEKVRGAAWLLPGTVTAANAEALQLASAGSEGRSGFNPMREGEAVFTGVVVGTYSACVAALPKEVPTDSPMAGQDYFFRHAESLPVVCKPLALTAQPTAVTVELAVTLPPYIPN